MNKIQVAFFIIFLAGCKIGDKIPGKNVTVAELNGTVLILKNDFYFFEGKDLKTLKEINDGNAHYLFDFQKNIQNLSLYESLIRDTARIVQETIPPNVYVQDTLYYGPVILFCRKERVDLNKYFNPFSLKLEKKNDIMSFHVIDMFPHKVLFIIKRDLKQIRAI